VPDEFRALTQFSSIIAEVMIARSKLTPEHRAWIAETLRAGGMPTLAHALHEDVPPLPFDAELERLSEPT
jgi:hypothetical protein